MIKLSKNTYNKKRFEIVLSINKICIDLNILYIQILLYYMNFN